jgi:hypothetical protein
LLELGIDLKASVEEVSPNHLVSRGKQPRVNERFGSHDNGAATFEMRATITSSATSCSTGLFMPWPGLALGKQEKLPSEV